MVLLLHKQVEGPRTIGRSTDSVCRRIGWGMAGSGCSFGSRRGFASRRESCRLSREGTLAVRIQMYIVGCISNTRYVERPEQQELTLKQAPLGRLEATRAALIPIRKTAAWWNLTQEERRNIFENKSHHIAEGIRYLPSVARQLYHSRDIGEPFDFLTWFEYAPQHSEAFEELVRTLRNTEEWRYVDREIDIRLARD